VIEIDKERARPIPKQAVRHYRFCVKSGMKSTNSVYILVKRNECSDVLGAPQLGQLYPEHIELTIIVLDNRLHSLYDKRYRTSLATAINVVRSLIFHRTYTFPAIKSCSNDLSNVTVNINLGCAAVARNIAVALVTPLHALLHVAAYATSAEVYILNINELVDFNLDFMQRRSRFVVSMQEDRKLKSAWKSTSWNNLYRFQSRVDEFNLEN
jgi:hypothetical protein